LQDIDKWPIFCYNNNSFINVLITKYMPERQYIPSEDKLTTSEIESLGGEIKGLKFNREEKTDHRRAGKKAVLVAAGLMAASEGKALAQRVTGYEIGNVIREAGQIYRTREEAKAHKREVEARQQEIAMRAAIEAGGEIEANVSKDGRTVSATTNPERLKFAKEVRDNQRELVKIYQALKITKGDFAKMWQALDKAGQVSPQDRKEIEEKWEEIVKILIQRGAIK
jgi:hypothetical protein